MDGDDGNAPKEMLVSCPETFCISRHKWRHYLNILPTFLPWLCCLPFRFLIHHFFRFLTFYLDFTAYFLWFWFLSSFIFSIKEACTMMYLAKDLTAKWTNTFSGRGRHSFTVPTIDQFSKYLGSRAFTRARGKSSARNLKAARGLYFSYAFSSELARKKSKVVLRFTVLFVGWWRRWLTLRIVLAEFQRWRSWRLACRPWRGLNWVTLRRTSPLVRWVEVRSTRWSQAG